MRERVRVREMVRVRVRVSPAGHLAPVGGAACPLPRLRRVPHVAARAWFGWGARIGLRGWGLGVGVGVGLRGWDQG